MTAAVGRIRTTSTFRALSRPDGRGSAPGLSVAYLSERREGEPPVRIGFAVSKRFGNAVERNRIRRRLRAAAQVSGANLRPGAYVVRPEPTSAALPFEVLRASLEQAAGAAASRAAAR